MLATGLDIYADRLASKLSGGNKRKLALAIALIGACYVRACAGEGLTRADVNREPIRDPH